LLDKRILDTEELAKEAEQYVSYRVGYWKANKFPQNQGREDQGNQNQKNDRKHAQSSRPDTRPGWYSTKHDQRNANGVVYNRYDKPQQQPPKPHFQGNDSNQNQSL